jgi:hypothetical protein
MNVVNGFLMVPVLVGALWWAFATGYFPRALAMLSIVSLGQKSRSTRASWSASTSTSSFGSRESGSLPSAVLAAGTSGES